MVPPSAIGVNGTNGNDVQQFIPHRPLTVEAIAAHRAKAPKMNAGVAAWTSSDLYKSPPDGKPKAKRWDHRLTEECKSRKPSSLKGAAKFLKNPGLISLGGGLPCPEYFPIESLSFKSPTPPHFSEAETKTTGQVLTAGKYDILEADGSYDLAVALNYGQGTGAAQMLRFVTEHTEMINNPPYDDWQCCLTVGSTHALDQTYRMFCERGDFIMSEEFTFASAMETALPMGINCVGIKMDSEGLLPESMDEILSNWDEKERGARKPFLLYTVPSGQNPTGATQGFERRKAIYRVAQKHDVYIIEDEPYYFLQMEPYSSPATSSTNGAIITSAAPATTTNDAFLRALIPTYLSIDTDGRVMRMDSFSKVIAPGTRVGWITASAQIVERFTRHNECSVQNPSGLSQMVLYKLLDESWGHEGYLSWLRNIRTEYTRRRNGLLHACEKFLPREVVSWNPPAAGMFLWMKVNHKLHPKYDALSYDQLEEQIFLAAVDKGVLVSRGSWFLAERSEHARGKVPDEMFFRATFAAATEDKMTIAIERFGEAIREIFNLEA
ncbi:aromatic amino acid aminotransferase-like protein [Xylogone sp. PMI_703]|nr:aromatic amino acid aminotransferase-like protein [Xylogone sp. PMI_703]